jgi:hypothetical protein
VAETEFDPVPLLLALVDAGVDFVLIGGLAGGAHGSSYPTFDVDVAYSRDHENLERLAALLRELGATLRGAPPGLPFQLDAKTLEAGGNFTFDTRLGKLDVLAYAPGAPSYDRLRAEGKRVTIEERPVVIASLDHLIGMKEAAGRTKDKLMATEYRTLADEQRGL